MPRGVLVDWDRATLRKEYLEEKKSISQIAKRMEITYTAVQNALVRFDIPRRHKGSEPREKHPSWKGGRVGDSYGYIQVKMRSHPRANKQGYVREHILIWEEVHNKSLPDGWVVHHLNGIKSDNRPSNLIALPSKKHRYWIPKLQKRIRELEVENKQLRKALKNNQTVFTV